MRRLQPLTIAALLLAACALPAVARAQDDAGEDAEVEDADAQASDEGDGYEPDQRGYEPDQRGYEPDQRGAEGGDGGGGGGGGDEQAETGGESYEPDQRGDVDEPSPVSADVEVRETAYGMSASDESSFGLDLRLWLGAGGTLAGVFAEDNLLRDVQQGGFGGGYGVSLGLRFGPVSVGPRHSLFVDTSVALMTFGLEGSVRLLPERFSPFVRVAVSYAHALGFTDALPGQSASGLLTELGVGFGGRVLGPMTLGAELSAGWLALFRGAAPDCTGTCSDATLDLTQPGQSHGLTLRGTLWVGFEM